MLAKIYGYLAAAGGLLVAILAALGLAKREGRKEAQTDELKKSLEQAKEASEIDSKVRDSSSADIANELQKYTRDK